MPTNPRRTVIEQKTVDFLRVTRFSTGALDVSRIESQSSAFALTNTLELYETGYLDKLIALLVNPETFKLQSRFPAGIKLEFSPRLSLGMTTILDSELKASAKLAYLVSFLAISLPILPETLAVVFKARSDPMSEIADLFPPVPNVKDDALIKHSLYPDFMPPRDFKIKSDAEYRKYCLTVSFLSSPSSIRYCDFMLANSASFFIPTYPIKIWSRGKLYAPVNIKYVEDLYPREYDRFMRYFNHDIVRELRPWARKRFNEGLETVSELNDKGANTSNMNALGWRPVLNYLTADEALAFNVFITKRNGIASIYRGASKDVASLIAYYWVEGGPDKLNQLALHISDAQLGSIVNNGVIQSVTLAWHNPFAQQNGRRPDLMPYVKALVDPVLKEFPLEWALASY